VEGKRREEGYAESLLLGFEIWGFGEDGESRLGFCNRLYRRVERGNLKVDACSRSVLW
jgi:hypothetical protein